MHTLNNFESNNAYDALYSRVTDADAVMFSRLKVWSAASQVAADKRDADIMALCSESSLCRYNPDSQF